MAITVGRARWTDKYFSTDIVYTASTTSSSPVTIFPAPVKTDAIDARRILELFRLSEHLPLTKNALQEVAATPVENTQLKRYTRRRKQLVWERVRAVNRIQSDLHAVCPSLMAITGNVDNIWFLNFLTCRDKLTQLATLRKSSLLAIHGVGKTYASQILAWQAQAQFAPDVEWVGEMILQDARRILALGRDIKAVEQQIAEVATRSELAQTIDSIPGFSKITMAEIAGEVGTLARFKSESGLAMYMGMTALDNSSGKKNGAKTPRYVNTRAKAAMDEGLPWLTTDYLLRQLADDVERARVRYNELVQAGIEEDHAKAFHQQYEDSRVLGDDDFMEQAYAESETTCAQVPELKFVIQTVADYYKIKSSTLGLKSRGHKASEARSVIGWLSMEIGAATLSHLAKLFNRDIATISGGVRRIRMRSLQDAPFKARLDQWLGKLTISS